MNSEERKDGRRIVGRRLREVREAQGRSREEVEQAIKVHAHHLEALERGDYEALPSPLWARGFLAMYANYLGLDGEQLAGELLPLRRPSRLKRYLMHHWRALLAALSTIGIAMSIVVATSLHDGRLSEAASVVMVGAGDIASCSSKGDEATAKLLDDIPGMIFTTGDNAYESGTASEFKNCYGPTWGRHKARTKPSVGNHEYETAGASGYFRYFGAAAGDPSKGYYSYDRGEWHIISLNGMCERVGGCGATSPMVTWLKKDLAANPKKCTLAYFHHPLFSSGKNGSQAKMRPTWDALYAANADVVVNGHDHAYERFSPQRPDGTLDNSRGIREFVVGTGGNGHYAILDPIANSEVHNDDTYGVLKLTLHPTSYEWNFLPVAGRTFTDSGSDSCH